MPVTYYTSQDVEHIVRVSVQLGRLASAFVNVSPNIERADLVRDMAHFNEIFEPYLRIRASDTQEKANRFYQLCLEDLISAINY